MFRDCSLARGDSCFGLVELIEYTVAALAILLGAAMLFIKLRKAWRAFLAFPFSPEECPWRGSLPGLVSYTKYVLLYRPIYPSAMCMGVPLAAFPAVYVAKCYGCGIEELNATEETPHP